MESTQGSNVAKLREALQQAKIAILAARKKMGVENPIILEIIDAALAAPERNCDKANVGLDLYKHFRAPEGMREMPPEWVDAIASFCNWVVAYEQTECKAVSE